GNCCLPTSCRSPSRATEASLHCEAHEPQIRSLPEIASLATDNTSPVTSPLHRARPALHVQPARDVVGGALVDRAVGGEIGALHRAQIERVDERLECCD